jgi:hypothetical protein
MSAPGIAWPHRNGLAEVFLLIAVSDCPLNNVRPVLMSLAQYGPSLHRLDTAWRWHGSEVAKRYCLLSVLDRSP